MFPHNTKRFGGFVSVLLAAVGLWTLPEVTTAKEPGEGTYGFRTVEQYKTLNEWNENRDRVRTDLAYMLGLDPMPERTPLEATITGTIEREGFIVEKLHYQSSPGLYVTANLYRPKTVTKPLPAILYVCGHGKVKKNGISYGNKTHYQHHGAWFARNGYVCLTIDTLQLGEIEGVHHGLHRENRWWWVKRGYTPAGVEAWNGIRGIDYLVSRPEVDPERIGVTGRSGGGAYSWWIAALDVRVKAAAPVAGITTLKNHIFDGLVKNHCDCMYYLNAEKMTFDHVSSLVAPRPLLIANTDSDPIFPLGGVVEIYDRTRHVYELYRKPKHLGLAITPGPHADTQELRMPVFRWFNHHLKGDDSPIEIAAVKFFEPEELKVFETLPENEKNTTIDQTFVPEAKLPPVPKTKAEWETIAKGWREEFERRVPVLTESGTPAEYLIAGMSGAAVLNGDEKSVQDLLEKTKKMRELPYHHRRRAQILAGSTSGIHAIGGPGVFDPQGRTGQDAMDFWGVGYYLLFEKKPKAVTIEGLDPLSPKVLEEHEPVLMNVRRVLPIEGVLALFIERHRIELPPGSTPPAFAVAVDRLLHPDDPHLTIRQPTKAQSE